MLPFNFLVRFKQIKILVHIEAMFWWSDLQGYILSLPPPPQPFLSFVQESVRIAFRCMFSTPPVPTTLPQSLPTVTSKVHFVARCRLRSTGETKGESGGWGGWGGGVRLLVG